MLINVKPHPIDPRTLIHNWHFNFRTILKPEWVDPTLRRYVHVNEFIPGNVDDNKSTNIDIINLYTYKWILIGNHNFK